MRRLVVFWLACAAVGFLAAIGAAFALSIALDGDAAWRVAPPAPRLAQRKPPAAPSESGVARTQNVLAPALSPAD